MYNIKRIMWNSLGIVSLDVMVDPELQWHEYIAHIALS